MIITTESGSKYILDLDKRTWTQEKQGNPDTPVRTKSGIFREYECAIGAPLRMTMPPLREGMSFRAITTTDVVSIEA